MEAEEECRSMVSDCLAHLAFMSPAPLATWLQQQLANKSAGARGVAVAAMKHALNESTHDASHLTQYGAHVVLPLHAPCLPSGTGSPLPCALSAGYI